MRQRLVGWAAVIGLVAGVVGIGLVAVSTGGGGKPRPLPLQVGALGAERSAAAGVTSDMAYPAFAGVEYRVAGELRELDDHARAYSLGRQGDVERVAELARALGLSGKVVTEDGGWTVTDGDRQLRVDRFAGLPWNYGMYVQDVDCPPRPLPADDVVTDLGGPERGVVSPPTTVGCAVARPVPIAEPVADPVAGSGSAGSAGSRGEATVTAVAPPPGAPVTTVPPPPDAPVPSPVPLPEPERPADLPARGEAERIGRELLGKAGLDLDDPTVRVEDGFSQWFVAARPTVEGLPTVGWEWGVGVGPKGRIEHAHGFLAEPVRGDLYPLVGVATGVERLKRGFGFGGWFAYAPAGAEPAMAVTPHRECPPDADCPEPEPVVRTIEDVRLGLLFSPVYGERAEEEALLVPAYLFRLDGGDEVPVVAVADEFLPEPPEPQPVPEPMPAPGPGGAQQCTGSAGGVAPDAGTDVNQPMTVEACGPGQVEVGEEASFTLTAYDPDAVIVTGDCGGPQARFGDGPASGVVCDLDCPSFASDTAKEPGKHGQTFTHVYEEPGTYAATFTVRSGSACDGHPWGNVGEVTLRVSVTE